VQYPVDVSKDLLLIYNATNITLLSIFLLFVRFFSSVGSHEME
jgi:hypothetical protein